MWAKRGEPGHCSPGRTSSGYPFTGLITKVWHPPARIPASDFHKLCLSCRTVAGIPPVEPHVMGDESMYSGGRPAKAAAHGGRALLPIYGVQYGVSSGVLAVVKRH